MNPNRSTLAVFVLLLLIWPVQGTAAELGLVVFQAGFDGPDGLAAWEPSGVPGVRIEPGPAGSKVLCVDRPADEGPGYRTLRTRLTLEKVRGARLKIEAQIKARQVAEPPHPWNGVKCMVHVLGPNGPRWMHQNLPPGTFDWRPVRFTAEVPELATEAWLVLGLEQTTGTAWFKDVKVTVVGRRRQSPATPPSGPVYKGHAVDRLRGTMISPRVTEADLRVLGGQWRANHVRWQLLWGSFPHSPADSADAAAYQAWLESALDHLDRLLPVCAELGILVAVDLHTPPGGRNESSECRMFHDAALQEHFVAVWEKIATRYRSHPAIWGYDLVNEPVEGVVPDGLADWHALATRTARRIRQIDPQRAIIVEPVPWGSPEGLDWFEPLDVPGVVYSVHMYAPFQFTHQGIYGNSAGVAYPGEVAGKFWDKTQLGRVLAPAIRYQRDYNVHLYIGEFSAIRWAPNQSAYRYLRDCIEIFEERGWDWAYHAFREWDGWSVEHGPARDDHTPSLTPTRRQELLCGWFAKNQRGVASPVR